MYVAQKTTSGRQTPEGQIPNATTGRLADLGARP